MHSENKVVSFCLRHRAVPAVVMVTAEEFLVLLTKLVFGGCFSVYLIFCFVSLQVLVKQLDTILSTLNDILNERCVLGLRTLNRFVI